MVNHSARSHAILSASGASRWLACPPSAQLEDKEPDITSEFAEEGTLAHEIAELYLRKEIGDIGTRKRNNEVKKLKNNPLYDDEMLKHAQEYADYVMSKRTIEGAEILVEERLDFSAYVPEGFGTGDCVIIQDGVVSVIDYKYGKGVKVDAKENNQMRIYGLGAIDTYEVLYDFETVEMCIFQPRMNNVSESTMQVDALYQWADEVLIPTAEIAYKGEGQKCAGEHCKFCKLADKCKTLAEYTMSVIGDDFKDETDTLNEDYLQPDDIADILSKMKLVKTWLDKIEKKAIRDIQAGEEIPGYKVVEGKSNRKYNHPDAIVHKLKQDGIAEAMLYKPKELITLTSMEKLLGKKGIEELTHLGLIIKPQGKPTVAPISDRRPDYATTVANDFEIEK